jgi:GPH family glycoside/pentoside/hexuronide:cation symporter
MTQETAANNAGQQVRDHVPIPTKVSYSLGTALDMWGLWLYPSVAFAVFNIYLGVSPWLVGLALTLIRVYDAISDPVVGWISDNFRSKYGRRRPFILVAGILCGLGLPGLFLLSPAWVEIKFLGVSVAFWYMILSSMIYIPIFSFFTVPYNSLGNELSPDYEERTSIMTYRSAIQKVFEVGNFYALRFTNLAWFLIPGTGKQNVLLGVIMAIFSITIFFRVKERYYESVVVKIKERISIKSAFYETLTCRPFLIMMLVGASFTLGTSMVGTLGYYATVYYVCGGSSVSGNDWNFWMGLSFMIGGLIGAPLLNRVAYVIGKRSALVVAASIGIIGYGGSWYLYTPDIPWLQTTAAGLMGLAAAGLWMLHSSIGADVIDYDELQTGKRREGSFTGCAQYILKLGNSMGGLLAGSVIGWAGFNASLGAQSANTIFWIRAMLAVIPIIGLSMVIVFILQLPLTKQKCQEIRLKLEARRGQV